MKKEDLIKNIKYCGQSLIDNAEAIASYTYWHDLSIHCYPADAGCVPRITIDTTIFPEGFINEYPKD